MKNKILLLLGITALLVGGRTSLAAAKARPAWVIPEKLNVRSGPGTDRDLIGSVSRGTKLYVTAFANNWCWAKLPNGKWGWVAEWHLQFSWDQGKKLAEEAAASRGAAGSSSSSQPAWINVDTVNVRTGAGTNYDKRGKLHQGDKVYIIESDGEWCKCRTPGGYGWIRRDLLETDVQAGRRLAAGGGGSSTAPASTAKGYVKGERVHLRAGPGTDSDIKATLVKGQTLYVTQTRGDWCKAHVHGGEEGWIAKQLIKFEGGSGRTATPSAPASPATSPGSSKDVSELTAWIAEDVVRVRYGPGLDHGVKMKLSRGAKVRIVDVSGHWCKVKAPSGGVGWVAGWVMNFKEPDQNVTATEGSKSVEVRVGWVARPEVNVRVGPGLDQKEIGEAVLGTQVIILDEKGDWYKVALDNGTTGWMASWLIDTREQRIARKAGGTGSSRAARYSPASSVGRSFVHTAMRYRGSPYVSGGSSPSGFDCSGFVSFVLRQHGVRVSRSSRMLFHEGTPVSRNELVPGDIVFFRNTYRQGISHVGIYMGNNQFIHASNRRGGVKISSLDSAYYAPRYAGARRMR